MSVNVSDADGETLSATYSWQVVSNTYSGATLVLDSTMVSPLDSVSCTVSVSDGYGGSVSNTVMVVVENTAPVSAGEKAAPTLVATTDWTPESGVQGHVALT